MPVQLLEQEALELEGLLPQDRAWRRQRPRCSLLESPPRWSDLEGVAVRVGHHCAEPVMRRFGEVSAGFAYGADEPPEQAP